MKVAMGADHGGFALKEEVKKHLEEQGYEITDFGCYSEDSIDYNEVATTVATKVRDNEFDKGILICGTGMGMSIVANKHEGVHGAACETVYTAEKARAINDANVLCMGGWLVAPFRGVEMAKTFLETSFTQNLEAWRAEKLKVAREDVRKIEKESFNK